MIMFVLYRLRYQWFNPQNGPWILDSGTNQARPHSSIQDIRDTILLYRRAGVDLSKLNMGLSLYGRSYRLLDPKCKAGYNCRFTGPGSNGPLTNAGMFAEIFINRQ